MEANRIQKKVVILGSGPAGLTAAIYASRAQLEPLVIDGPQPGGQLTITTDVENYPGFSDGIMGPALMDEFRKQAERFGTEIINVWIDSVDLSKRPFTLFGKSSQDAEDITTIIEAETLIISTGASAKCLGLRYLRRIFLPRQADRGRWRRRYGDGRGSFPDQVRIGSNGHSPPR
jgi:thioredoxin reductase (NADPH)